MGHSVRSLGLLVGEGILVFVVWYDRKCEIDLYYGLFVVKCESDLPSFPCPKCGRLMHLVDTIKAKPRWIRPP